MITDIPNNSSACLRSHASADEKAAAELPRERIKLYRCSSSSIIARQEYAAPKGSSVSFTVGGAMRLRVFDLQPMR